ncbi:hypothetical protein [Arenibaculum pallidiluteum]|uniref:hypothetical protein n=1 Tax=Arenibaculum pallidiluteum TaxID=2812559 RepID=UPI001A97BD16|nr:hypothetical protein [Arenibaculum pallidiluteum]
MAESWTVGATALLGVWAALAAGCATLEQAGSGYEARLASMLGGAVQPPGAGQAAQPAAPVAPAEEPVSLEQLGVPLKRVADGIVAGPRPPDLVGKAAAEIAREYGPGLAGRLVIGTLTGGLGAAQGLPAGARHAWDATASLKAAADEQRILEEAYAEAERSREATALVPDKDRPAEAAALLKIAEAPAQAETAWTNPATGAAGRVAVGAAEPSEDETVCRAVVREYRTNGFERQGKGLICRQDGVWYDLS